MTASKRLLVLYGSQTFTAQEIAERIWRMTKTLGFSGPVLSMDEYPISDLIHEHYGIFVCATTGRGVEPDNMKHFWKFLLRANLPPNSLVQLKYGVLGLGDSSYAQFNFAGKKLHRRLKQLGATPLLDIGLCDYQHDLGHDGVLLPWIKQFFTILKQYFPDIELDKKPDFMPRWNVSLSKSTTEPEDRLCFSQDIYFGKTMNSNLNPLPLKVASNERTTDVSHFQDVRLIKLRSDEPNLNYKPGDVFNIRPRNSKEDIDDLFSIFETHNLDILPHHRLLVEEYHKDMPVPDYLQPPVTLYEIAEQYWDLRCYPTQYMFSLLALVSEDKLEKDKCLELSSPEGQEEWLNYCRRPKRTILEVIHDFHKSASKLTIQILFELFPTIKPRSFSIASSALPSGGHDIDLLVAVVEYRTKLKKPRLGLASNWLKSLEIGNVVYGWVKPGTFVFPDDVNIPYIMIGPGTGLAPFRSLLQDRLSLQQATRDSLHLFFGCRYRDKDFHCRKELEGMVEAGELSLYTAFSRDQDIKVYVQHKIEEHGEKLWRLINCENAHIFVSGSSKSMPDNVRDAFIDILCKHGGLCMDEAKQRMKEWENNGRYQTETW